MSDDGRGGHSDSAAQTKGLAGTSERQPSVPAEGSPGCQQSYYY